MSCHINLDVCFYSASIICAYLHRLCVSFFQMLQHFGAVELKVLIALEKPGVERDYCGLEGLPTQLALRITDV